MIELRGIGKHYSRHDRRVEVLRGLDLHCRAGEFVSLMGASGAGKSTLLQILGCLDTPTRGEYLFEGRDVSCMQPAELALIRNARIGFVFQSSYFVDYLDLIDNVALPALYARRRRTAADRERARELLASVGLEQRIHHLPAALSGGERQRAALARALFHRPSLLLADEPTGNLDAASADTVMQLLREMQGREAALIVVTHDPRIAAQAGKRLQLVDGRLEAHLAVVA